MEKLMSYKSTIVLIILFTLFTNSQSILAATNACDLVTKEVVEKYSGLKIINVRSKDRGAFTSCTYETDDWQISVGIIYFPGGKLGKNSDKLAEELQKEFERDGAPYKEPKPLADLGDAAVYYEAVDGGFHSIVVLSSSGNVTGRLVVSAPTHKAAFDIARAALAGK